jgi:formylglycine-generating enzyme
VIEISPEGRPCPCPDGYSCDPATETCVKGDLTGVGGAASSGGGGAGGGVIVPPPGMVYAGTFFIDATEVTRGAYADFLTAGPPATQRSECEWNDVFEPLAGADDCMESPYDLSMENLPITCIDWCDAAAYCAWAGKHLCGRIGGGATLERAELDDPAKSEWYAACSANGTRKFPYAEGLGGMGDGQACNTANSGGTPIGVGARVGCVGGYEGLHDMLGNVEEWEDACDVSATPKDAGCEMRGYAFYDRATVAECRRADRRPHRDYQSNSLGFRCCSDL